MASKVSEYITELNTLLKTIVFDGGTLESKRMIKNYLTPVRAKPLTEVLIFSSRMTTNFLESHLNKRKHFLTIRIRASALDREEQAQEDINYLEESIIAVLENALSNSVWGDGYLDDDQVFSQMREYNDNCFTKDITVSIVQRASTV